MLIVIIAWMYVVILMALTEHSFVAGLMTFLLYGLLPLSTVVYLLNTPARRARKKEREARDAGVQEASEPGRQMAADGVAADAGAGRHETAEDAGDEGKGQHRAG